MSKKYQHLLSPFKLGDTVFKNRMTASPSMPHNIQGPEPYPTEGFITHYANKAKNGAAWVVCSESGVGPGLSRDMQQIDKSVRMNPFDNRCQNYFAQQAEAIHFYGAKAAMFINVNIPGQYDVSTGIPSMVVQVGKDAPPGTPGEEIPASLLDGIAEDFAVKAAVMKQVGFDGIFLHMAYRMGFLSRFLSPLTNKRTDEYGGSIENRARFPVMVADRIKQKCGKDFLIEASMSGSEPPGGFTLEDAIGFAKQFSGHFDILQVRAGSIDPTHPTGYNLERTPLLYMAEAIKKSSAEIAIAAIGGFTDPQSGEDAIAAGKADFIAMARNWISNPNFGRLVYEGRDEDIVPCLRCNACHMNGLSEPPSSTCAVNPVWGLEHKIERMIEPPVKKKKVAVVGGGPAGMEAALVAAGRGHQVTLYEKTGSLGGLLKSQDKVSFKWPLKDFKEYQVRQIHKSGVRVFLNTEATPEMLGKEEYDVVLTAVGSEPVIPAIPGIDGKNVTMAPDVFGKEDTLAENVIVIGGGEVGVETGMHLAENGHQVTVIEMLDTLAYESIRVHFYTMFQEAWEKLPNFRYILNAKCTHISNNDVTYEDKNGKQHTIEAGSIVIAVGMKAKSDLALKYYNPDYEFFLIGDCNKAGNVRKAMRSAFSIASML